MKHTYSIIGMTSAHCVQTVKKALEGIDRIASAAVILEPPHVTITMHHHVSEELMNEALAEAGDYRIKLFSGEEHTEHSAHSNHQHEAAQPGGDEQTAKMHGDHGQHQMEGEHGDHNPAHGEMGHDHHRMMIEDFRKRFWVSLALTVPILILAPMIQEWLGVDWQFPGSKYLLFALSSVVYFYGGWPFIKGFFGLFSISFQLS